MHLLLVKSNASFPPALLPEFGLHGHPATVQLILSLPTNRPADQMPGRRTGSAHFFVAKFSIYDYIAALRSDCPG
jgi:hypothetical protein